MPRSVEIHLLRGERREDLVQHAANLQSAFAELSEYVQDAAQRRQRNLRWTMWYFALTRKE